MCPLGQQGRDGDCHRHKARFSSTRPGSPHRPAPAAEEQGQRRELSRAGNDHDRHHHPRDGPITGRRHDPEGQESRAPSTRTDPALAPEGGGTTDGCSLRRLIFGRPVARERGGRPPAMLSACCRAWESGVARWRVCDVSLLELPDLVAKLVGATSRWTLTECHAPEGHGAVGNL